jgi:hypothetical protein
MSGKFPGEHDRTENDFERARASREAGKSRKCAAWVATRPSPGSIPGGLCLDAAERNGDVVVTAVLVRPTTS